MLNKLKQNLITQGIGENHFLLVALSGGRDSVALLLALTQLEKSMCFQLLAAHFNHLLRDAESDADADFCRQFCQKLNVPLKITKENIATDAQGENIENYARKRRYQWFNQLINENAQGKTAKILTAHHMEDQGETLLLHIFRGAGNQGLVGMEIHKDNIMRPLLNVNRRELESFLGENQQTFRDDSSNFQTDYTRNKVRLEIMPKIQEINPNITKKLYDMSMICSAEEDFWADYMKIHLGKAQILDTKNQDPKNQSPEYTLAYPLADFENLPLAVKRRLLRILWQQTANSEYQLNFQGVEGILELPKGKTIHLPAGVVAKKSKGNLLFGRQSEENLAKRQAKSQKGQKN